MTTPNRRAGAVRADDEPRRKGFLWLLLAGLLALLLLGLILFLIFRNNGDDSDASTTPAPVTSSAPLTGGATPTGPATTGPSAPQTSSATSAPATTAPSASGSTGAPSPAPGGTAPGAPGGAAGAAAPGGLVGGAGVPAAPATGALATPDLLGTVLFATDSAEVTDQGREVIAAAAKDLKARNATGFQVTGYTDKVAGPPVNQELSQQRADAVTRLLQQELGTPLKATTDNRGENDPVADNATEEGRQLNRRATIRAIPAA